MMKKMASVQFWIFSLSFVILLGACSKGDTGPAGPAGSSGLTVYDASANALGKLASGNGPEIGILFSDNAYGTFFSTGKYANGSCATGYCAPAPVATTNSNVIFNPNGAVASNTKSYLFYTTADCSGTGYIGNLPSKNSIFRGPSGFLKASGTETQSTGLTQGSVYLHDMASCDLASGSGFCCVSSASGKSGYAITTAYTLPSEVPTYPFTGPLYLQ